MSTEIMRAALCLAVVLVAQPAEAKPRLIVLTDIGGDPDDQQSMVRLMTYANEFEIEGLIASASGTPGELKQAIVRPELIGEIVGAYAKVRPNLAVHAKGYPEAAALRRVIKSGNPRRGVGSLGAEHDTEGSRWIIAAADRSDPRPLNVSIWGGSTELAQALWRVKHDRSPGDLQRFVSKLRVYAIGHQDDTGPWIMQNFPELFYILANADPGDVLGRPPSKIDKRLSAYRGMYLGGDESLTSREWIDRNVRTNHGPLGALYPPKTWTAPNPHSALKEGDTPSWFYFLETGVNDPERPEWGGWGGRFRAVSGKHYNDAMDSVGDVTDARVTVWRWRPAYQSEFQARMDWCVTPSFGGANHAPSAVLSGDRSATVVQVRARSRERVELTASGTSDPDGNELSYRWFVYPEAGSYERAVDLESDGARVAFSTPEAAAGRTIHVVLEVKDGGAPPLYAYRRAIVSVMPSSASRPPATRRARP